MCGDLHVHAWPRAATCASVISCRVGLTKSGPHFHCNAKSFHAFFFLERKAFRIVASHGFHALPPCSSQNDRGRLRFGNYCSQPCVGTCPVIFSLAPTFNSAAGPCGNQLSSSAHAIAHDHTRHHRVALRHPPAQWLARSLTRRSCTRCSAL